MIVTNIILLNYESKKASKYFVKQLEIMYT